MKATRPPLTWTDFSALRWSGVDKPSSRVGKLGLQRFAKKQGLAYLDIVRRFESAADISLVDLESDSFVLKAANLWSGQGVYVLHKVLGTDLFYDVKNKKAWTEHALRKNALQLEEKIGKKIQFFIERRAYDEDASNHIPLDYKLFAFYGSVKFILQVDRNVSPPALCFFDGEFQAISDGSVFIPAALKQSLGEPKVPECAAQLIELAQQVSLQLQATFVSVDCYATPDGAVLGELTHTPGGPWYQTMYAFSEEFDLELGRAWRNAYKALNMDVPELTVPYVVELKGKKYRTIY